VQFTYQMNPADVFFGWCTSQVLGGTTAAGSAGGTIHYAHTVLDTTTPISAPNALDIGRLLASVTNRAGHVTEYVTNQEGQVIQVTDHDGATSYATLNRYNAEGELIEITEPRGNSTTIQYESGLRLVAGNAATVTHHANAIASDQPTRTLAFEHEPIFGNLLAATDARGNVTRYVSDYQEGNGIELDPYDVIPAIADSLLGIYDREAILDVLADAGVLFQESDVNSDGLRDQVLGNVVLVERPPATIPPEGGSPLASLEGDVFQDAWLTTTYDAYGQVTSHTDEEENVTVFLYYPETDPDGDGTPTPGSGLDATTGGYLRRRVGDVALPYPDPQLAGVFDRPWDIGRDSGLDPAPVEETTDYAYDASGNVTAVTDARGVRHEYAVNELDEVWRMRRAADVSASATRGGGLDGADEDLSGQAFAFAELWKPDANGNVVAHFVQNSGGTPDAVAKPGAPAEHFEEYWTYDILDQVRSEEREHGFAGETAAWSYAYDANENQTLVIFPEGNTKAYTFDFRDQMESITRGSGIFEASVVTFSRDANGNLAGYTDGRGLDTLVEYDGYDRVKRVVQPAGAEKLLSYDAESNATEVLYRGHPGGPSPVGNDTSQNVSIQRITQAFDERNRLIRRDQEDPRSALVDGALTPGDGKVSTVLNHDRLGRTVYVIDDDGSRSERLHDGAGRRTKDTDPAGNVVELGYDDAGNLVRAIERDKYPDGHYRSFETFYVLDSLDRLESVTDEIGRTERFGYDSRDNVVSRSDAVASLSPEVINGRPVNYPGNTTTIRVDGFGRVVLEESDLRVGGTGDGSIDSPPYNADGRITRTFSYDGNSRVRFATDDRGKTTEYQYDTLDRCVAVIYADGTSLTKAYDGNDNVVAWEDAVGSEATNTYDDENRLTAVDALVPSTVVGTTALRFEYDGLGRLTRSTDSVDGALGDGDDWVNEYGWDALGRVKTQLQGGRLVTTTWREEAKKESVVYPSGPTVQYAWDALERVTSVTQGVELAAYSYAGKDRLLERVDGAGVVQRYHDGAWNDAAYYDGARRPVRLEFQKNGATITGLEHGFDGAGNRRFVRRLHAGSKGDNTVYDSQYRLWKIERNVPANKVGLPGGSKFDVRVQYDQDGVHNRRKVIREAKLGQALNTTTTTYAVDAVQNYVTKTIAGVPPATTTQSFDANGNKTAFTDAAPFATYRYDFLNRLRRIEQGSASVEFDYDAQGKRVRTRVMGLAGYPAVTEFVHDGQHVIEEVDGSSGACLRRFVYADDIDEPVRFENLAFYPGTGSYTFEQDSHGEVVAIHDGSGSVVERYTYAAFGAPQFETPANVRKSIPASDFGNPLLFQGLRHEWYFEELYYCRARFIDSTDGTFLQRDALGVWGDTLNVGNAKSYCGSNPINCADPLGLAGDDLDDLLEFFSDNPVIGGLVAVASLPITLASAAGAVAGEGAAFLGEALGVLGEGLGLGTAGVSVGYLPANPPAIHEKDKGKEKDAGKVGDPSTIVRTSEFPKTPARKERQAAEKLRKLQKKLDRVGHERTKGGKSRKGRHEKAVGKKRKPIQEIMKKIEDKRGPFNHHGSGCRRRG
jgi:RHS repeat-associated protein